MTLVKFKNRFPSFTDEFFGGVTFDSIKNSPFSNSSVPAVNVKENEKNFEIQVAAPGFKKEHFNLKVDKDILSISSEIKDENKEEEGNYTRREFGYHSFSRTFNLPETVNKDAIHAKYEEGILRVSIPKKEEKELQTSRSIKIT